MLLIKTEIRSSTILNAGLGLFTCEFIPKNTLIWKVNFEIDRLIYANDITVDIQKRAIYLYMIDCYLLTDDHFMNHSVKPNIGIDARARCDIAKGNELLCNYNHVMFPNLEPFYEKD
jgi:SET domain-containing protein